MNKFCNYARGERKTFARKVYPQLKDAVGFKETSCHSQEISLNTISEFEDEFEDEETDRCHSVNMYIVCAGVVRSGGSTRGTARQPPSPLSVPRSDYDSMVWHDTVGVHMQRRGGLLERMPDYHHDR